ncbi:MAG: hypothetical protein RSD88_08660 [Anaerovoracaceae bacterium]
MNGEYMGEILSHNPKALTCTSVHSQCAEVSVPLELKPYATLGELETECCGEPIITLHQNQGSTCSCGCELTITQSVCIRIPLEYGTKADVGETTSCCKRTSNFNITP